MSKVLENFINEFITLHDQYRFKEDGLGGYLLITDGPVMINIYIDRMSSHTHLLASIGRLSAGHTILSSPFEEDQPPAREWFEFNIDDLPFALRIHHGLGQVLLDSWANITELEIVKFGNWIKKFYSKSEEWSHIFSTDIYHKSLIAPQTFTNLRFI